jgi:glycosyltransferase involved in cell wall biosynthesis
MNNLPISAIILTFNEEKNIDACLQSIIGCVGEIIVVDSYSTDATLTLAKKYTDKIYQHPYIDYAHQRKWAQNLPMKYDWVLHLDADEYIDEQLAQEITTCFQFHVDVDGFIMPRKVIFRNRWIKHGGIYPSYHARLFKKQKGGCEERLYDQPYFVDGSVAILKGNIITAQVDDLSIWKNIHKKWARWEAEEMVFYNKNRTLRMKFTGNPVEKRVWLRYRVYYSSPLFLRVILLFFYRFFIMRGFLDGVNGSLYHFYHGFWYRFLVDTLIFKYSVLKIFRGRLDEKTPQKNNNVK